MSGNATAGSRGPHDDGTASADKNPSGTVRLREIAVDLTAFQLRALAVVADHDGIHGLGIKDELEADYYPGEVRHGRLYPNLNTLVEKGLLDKGQQDDRTNNYTLTETGYSVLAFEVGWLRARQRDTPAGSYLPADTEGEQ